MGTIEIFDHTADVGFRIRGDDWDDLFRTAAEGVFDYIVVNREAVEPRESVAIALSADEPVELLATWLNELIFLSESRHRLFSRFEVRVDESGTNLRAEVRGEAIDRDRHILDHEVKAVTRHAMSIRPDEAGWLAELILDI
ncbi:archease [Singulisphaera rosea]